MTHRGRKRWRRSCGWPNRSSTASSAVAERPAIAKENASLPMLARHDLGETVLAILGRSGKPLLVDDVVALVAQLWDVVEVETVPTTEALLSPDAAIERIEQRQTLAVV